MTGSRCCRHPKAKPGSGRSACLARRRAYALPERLRANHWALSGEWTTGRECVVLEQAGLGTQVLVVVMVPLVVVTAAGHLLGVLTSSRLD